MKRGQSIFQAVVVAFLAIDISVGQLTSHSIKAVDGPSLEVFGELAMLDAFFLLLIYASIRDLIPWRGVFRWAIVGLFGFGVIFFFWQRSFTGSVMAEARSAIAEALPEARPTPFLYEVDLTREGLVFWCWVGSQIPRDQQEKLRLTAQEKVESRLREKFPAIKRVAEVRL